MYETTMPDPLETTVPDPVRRRRMSDGRRRAIEVCALICLVPGLMVARWIDDSKLAKSGNVPERVTVVSRGATGVIGHSQWRLLGRDAKAAPGVSTPGSVRITLYLQLRVLAAKGVKDVANITYRVRDRQGHVWSALVSGSDDPPVGSTVPVKVTADVPPAMVSRVVLEVREGPVLGAPRRTWLRVLRFAH